MRSALVALILAMLTLTACAALSWLPSPCPVNYADPDYSVVGDITRIQIPALHKTPLGIPVGPGVDEALVDREFLAVAKCMGITFHPCGVHAVMIAPNWELRRNVFGEMEQVFPCGSKTGFCSGVNQYPGTIIVTPDHHALRWEIARLMTGGDPNRCTQDSMSDVPAKNKPAIIAIVAAVSASAGYMAHDPLRAELKTAGLYGREPGVVIKAPPPAPPPAPAPVVLHQIEATRIIYDGEHGIPVEKPKVAPRHKPGVP